MVWGEWVKAVRAPGAIIYTQSIYSIQYQAYV